ncbi:MAG: ubiquinol-cytochrome c reductase iron-sulfur subunit [Kofleriaceae bacterium]
MVDDPDRRGFLKVATCAVGGGLGLAIVVPALRVCVAPTTAQTVTTPTDPIDLGALDRIKVGAPWQRIDVIAPVVKDAWTTEHDVPLGGAWVRRVADRQLQALSSVCPHLGCAVGWDGKGFLCPCHGSQWSASGALVANTGPAKRDLDPLPIEIKDGRLRLTWVRYKLDMAAREPA